MKAVVRIAVLLIAIVGLAIAGFTDISSTRAFTYCDAQIWQTPPPGYRYVSIIQCGGEETYELWEGSGGGTYIRIPTF